VAELVDALSAIVPGFEVEVAGSIASTNTELMQRARAGTVVPTLLVAERQTAGRGRLGRNWHSLPDTPGADDGGGSGPLGALTFSLGMALAPLDWSGLSLAVGVSVARSLHPGLGLKWPNDLWFDGRKLAGILLETAGTGERRFTVIGIGINILPRDAAGLSTAPACLREIVPALDAPAVLLRIVPALVQAITVFEAQGFAPFRSEFERRDVLRDRAVVLSDGSGGIASGVDASGALLVHTSGGMKSVTSAEVSVRPAGARPGH